MVVFILLTEAVVLWSTHLLHIPPVFATLTTSFRASILSLSLSLSLSGKFQYRTAKWPTAFPLFPRTLTTYKSFASFQYVFDSTEY